MAPAVGGVFARQAQDSLTNHVAGHLITAAAQRDGLAGQVALPDFQQLMVVVDDTKGADDIQRGVDLQESHIGVEEPDDRPGGGR